MKVLLITKSFTKGGAASGASNLANALQEAGAEVLRFDAYAQPKCSVLRIIRIVERIIERVFFNAETHCLRLGPPVFNLHELCARHKPDIIQMCDISGNIIRFSDLLNLPVPVVHRMSDFWPYGGSSHYKNEYNKHSIANWSLKKTIFNSTIVPDMRVAPSEWLAGTLFPNDQQVQVIRNAQFIPNITPRVSPKEKTLNFGFISNNVFDPRKGFHCLPSFLKELAAQGFHITLHIYGHIPKNKIPYIPNVNVIAEGSFSRNNLAQVYENFDILLCPSEHDNSPNVLTEALAYGRPVIAQKGSGMNSYVTNQTGFLIDFYNKSFNEFNNACYAISSNYNDFSIAALKYADSFLNPKIIGADYLKLYKRLIKNKK